MRSILCVEDHDDSRELLSFLIRRVTTDTEVRSVSTGLEAMELINEKEFDLYILDIWLPDIDGIKLCRAIRGGGSQKPILFLTAAVTAVDQHDAFDAGATMFLKKPFDIARIPKIVQNYLQN